MATIAGTSTTGFGDVSAGGTPTDEEINTLGKTGRLTPEGDAHPVIPVSLAAPWQVAIAAGGLDDADNSGSDITDVDLHIGSSPTARRILQRQKGLGTLLRLRMRYADTIGTAPVVQAFGRFNALSPWQRLRNKANAIDITMTVDASDAGEQVDGSLVEWTTPDNLNHTIDCDGCNEFLFLVKTAAAGDGAAGAVLEVKII